MIKNLIRETLLQPKTPQHLKKRQRFLSSADKEKLAHSLRENFFSKNNDSYLKSSLGINDLNDHLTGRLQADRCSIIPWLDNVMKLDGKHILEIGCGTGASTIALAEQNANLIGIDVDSLAVKDAKVRCKLYDLNVEFKLCNAVDIEKLFSHKKFDMIIFYASLEHMTYSERIASLSSAWSLLGCGGILAIIETPNRLWHFDSHTSILPFFHWLPDDLAMEYSKMSSRESFNKGFSTQISDEYTRFMRWGRGMSYHELELAISDIDLKESINCHANFIRNQRFLSWLKWRISKDHSYQTILSKQNPALHHAFFQPYLNLTIKK